MTYRHIQQAQELEDEWEEEDEDLAHIAAGVEMMIIGVEEARLHRAERCKPSRLYLCCAQLLSDS